MEPAGTCGTVDESYLLKCQRYIELNPLRAGMAGFPGGNRWSSYRANAEGRADVTLTLHALYDSFGVDALSAVVRCAVGGTGSIED